MSKGTPLDSRGLKFKTPIPSGGSLPAAQGRQKGDPRAGLEVPSSGVIPNHGGGSDAGGQSTTSIVNRALEGPNTPKYGAQGANAPLN